ncbi:hypothetical protein XENTR_v10010022 [Xenopus tropicalis]|nr:hypothetical protein XENTR_v10010022 [Xenopus tropicalis]
MLDLPIPIMSLFQQIMLLWTKKRYCAPCVPEKCIDFIEQQRRVQKLKLLWIMLLWTKKRYCAPCIPEKCIDFIEQVKCPFYIKEIECINVELFIDLV